MRRGLKWTSVSGIAGFILLTVLVVLTVLISHVGVTAGKYVAYVGRFTKYPL